MRRVNMFIVMTAMVFVAAGSSKGNTSLGLLRLDRAAVTASGQSSLPMMKGGKSLIKTFLRAAPESTVAQLLVAATAGDDEKNPPSRSAHCPPDKDDHKSGDNQAEDSKDKDNKNKDNKDKNDKDQHDNCGKGDAGKNP